MAKEAKIYFQASFADWIKRLTVIRDEGGNVLAEEEEFRDPPGSYFVSQGTIIYPGRSRRGATIQENMLADRTPETDSGRMTVYISRTDAGLYYDGKHRLMRKGSTFRASSRKVKKRKPKIE